MAGDLVLRYLIEGAKQSHKISIRPVHVDDLREHIFMVEVDRFSDLVPTHRYLTILKIDVDLNHAGRPLPLLRFNRDDEGVEEVFPWQMISDVWPEPSCDQQIQFFVTYNNLPRKYEERRRKLEAAQLVYSTFWGENLDDILSLQSVPDYGNFKYLSEEQIVSLKLRSLLYHEVVLLVRQEYDVCYKDLKELQSGGPGGGVVVTGQPGIGKTCFLYYLLLCRLSKKETVAFQVDDIFFLFQETGIMLFDSSTRVESFIPSGTWALSDSNFRSGTPCNTFLAASTRGNAWIVQTSFPSQNRWSKWMKEQNAYLYWMKPYSDKEITALGLIKHLDVEHLCRNYHLWGPSAHTCITLMDDAQVKGYTHSVASTADKFIRDIDQFIDISEMAVSHQLLVAQPSKTKLSATAAFASSYILGFVLCAYAKCDLATRQSFYQAISGHTWFSTSASNIFQTGVLLWSHYSPARELILCNPTEVHLPVTYPVRVLEIPACRENMAFLFKAEDLGHIATFTLPVCLVPVSQTFATVDAIVLTKDCVITVQMTVTSRPDAKSIRLQRIYEGLPSKFLQERIWCHVFLTDTEDKVESLQKLQVEAIEGKGIYIYSAFINMDKLDSIITSERAEKLKDDIATVTNKMYTSE